MTRSAGALLIAGAILVTGLCSPAYAEKPRALIETFNAALLDTMRQAKTIGYSGRYDKLAPTIKATFDLAFMARYSAGRHWRGLSKVQQDKLVDAFSRITIATYARRFNGYSGERFHILSEEDARRGTKVVRTELEKKDGERIKLTYLLRETKAGWRTIDIFVKSGISELATKRSEYGATLKRKGYNGLIAILEKKIADLRNRS
jgi:phospholipid transport system substrate-binding protein